jgi:hypothetical protein
VLSKTELFGEFQSLRGLDPDDGIKDRAFCPEYLCVKVSDGSVADEPEPDLSYGSSYSQVTVLHRCA